MAIEEITWKLRIKGKSDLAQMLRNHFDRHRDGDFEIQDKDGGLYLVELPPAS